MVRFHLLITPEIVCKMGTSPVLENISKAIIHPNVYFIATQCKNYLT
ncbi:MAG TPA: hypothetical protein VFR47_24755 [Anaerolineales bacterium]|nr:hypothetical protein [Anaerolineales bacterium]